MVTIIHSGSEARFNLGGRVLRVRAKFNRRTIDPFRGVRAEWTVKMELGDVAASFKYFVGIGVAGCNKYIDFADFAECIACDANTVASYYNFNDFAASFNYTDRCGECLRVWRGCKDTTDKLRAVFFGVYGIFMNRAEDRDW